MLWSAEEAGEECSAIENTRDAHEVPNYRSLLEHMQVLPGSWFAILVPYTASCLPSPCFDKDNVFTYAVVEPCSKPLPRLSHLEKDGSLRIYKPRVEKSTQNKTFPEKSSGLRKQCANSPQNVRQGFRRDSKHGST
jgi:hypothetical protein